MQYVTLCNNKIVTSLDQIPDGYATIKTVEIYTIDEMDECIKLNDTSMSSGMFCDAVKAIARSNKIIAIKLLRGVTGWGLTESKYFVESL